MYNWTLKYYLIGIPAGAILVIINAYTGWFN